MCISDYKYCDFASTFITSQYMLYLLYHMWFSEFPLHHLQVMKYMIHCADLSNPAKPLDLCIKWTHKVNEEFFLQVSHYFRDCSIRVLHLYCFIRVCKVILWWLIYMKAMSSCTIIVTKYGFVRVLETLNS